MLVSARDGKVAAVQPSKLCGRLVCGCDGFVVEGGEAELVGVVDEAGEVGSGTSVRCA